MKTHNLQSIVANSQELATVAETMIGLNESLAALQSLKGITDKTRGKADKELQAVYAASLDRLQTLAGGIMESMDWTKPAATEATE
ncbi:MAG: hypothetical protein LBS60_09055 [Deltaproteobacteria bacterium]|jgi:MFS superfamily sulfate permease-like transporter|nr:hypothetical protein [Deltaproteobacteria bacterium]